MFVIEGSDFPNIIQKFFKMIETILEQEFKFISPEMRMAVACKHHKPRASTGTSLGSPTISSSPAKSRPWK